MGRCGCVYEPIRSDRRGGEDNEHDDENDVRGWRQSGKNVGREGRTAGAAVLEPLVEFWERCQHGPEHDVERAAVAARAALQ